MLDHEVLRQLTHDVQLQRRREAEAERLATQARREQQRRRRSALHAVLEVLRRGRAAPRTHGV